jgi:hypothetical protein
MGGAGNPEGDRPTIDRMPASRKRLLGPAQWAALRHPRRLEVIVTMEALAPCSIAELAASMDCRPASLYRHVQTLARAGLLREAGRKSVGRRWASLYELGPACSLDHFHAPSGRGLREHGELVLALSRPAGRAYMHGVLAQRGAPQNLAKLRCSSMFERTWLDTRSLAEVQRLVHALYKLVQQGRRTRRGERFQLSLMFAPDTR